MKKLDPKAVWILSATSSMLLLLFGAFVLFIVTVIWRGKALFWVHFHQFLWYMLFSLPVFLCLGFIMGKLAYNNYGYELDEDGFVEQSGIMNKRLITIPYHNIQTVDIERGPLEHLVGLAVLVIRTGAILPGMGKGAIQPLEARLYGVTLQEAYDLRKELIKRVQRTL